jgi:predicted N-acetyltransferase YhbS
MGRIVGDGAINFDIVDVAVDPAHQGKGLGRLVMEKLVAWLDANAFDGAYVTLVADVPELYAKFGLKAFGRKAKGWPASGEPGVVSSRFLPGKERCPNGNSSCGAFLTMLNAIHIARIP